MKNWTRTIVLFMRRHIAAWKSTVQLDKRCAKSTVCEADALFTQQINVPVDIEVSLFELVSCTLVLALRSSTPSVDELSVEKVD